jgi:hypothetical protein
LSNPQLPLRAIPARKAWPEAPAVQIAPVRRSQVHSGRGARFAVLDAEIFAEKKRQSPPPEALRRLANSIRNEVSKWRAANPNYQEVFEMRFGSFVLFSDWQDAGWNARAELLYKARVERVEECLHPSEGRASDQPPRGITIEQWERMKSENMCTRKTDVAAAHVNLAHLYHEQRKFRVARESYEEALGLYETALGPERQRKLMIPWIATQIAKCDDSQDSDPYPRLEKPHKVHSDSIYPMSLGGTPGEQLARGRWCSGCKSSAYAIAPRYAAFAAGWLFGSDGRCGSGQKSSRGFWHGIQHAAPE